MFLNIHKVIYDKPIANIISNDERLKAFPLRSGLRQGCPSLCVSHEQINKILKELLKICLGMYPPLQFSSVQERLALMFGRIHQ